MKHSPAQLDFDTFSEGFCQPSRKVAAALERLASDSNTEARGAVFTRTEVVEFILDLAGYTADRPLHRSRLLEPSFGGGDFLLPVIDRLFTAWRRSGNTDSAVDALSQAIRAVELHRETFAATHRSVLHRLEQEGLSLASAAELADHWLVQGDFLLAPLAGEFDFIVGNPPYVRQELIPAPLLAEYRNRYRTLYDRADLYIPFIERSLSKLAPGGHLGFICSDRWMKNQYGGPLRALVAENFHLKVYVDMVDTAAFSSEVSAYPAITIISREGPGATRVARRPSIDGATLTQLAGALLAKSLPNTDTAVREMSGIFEGDRPWLLETSEQLALLRRLERQFPTLEEAGCKVGIGVATGADRAFIGDFATLDIEPDRKLPLATTDDILSGEVLWRGLGVVNPFTDEGALVDLGAYPRLQRYLEERKEVIAGRHCARKNPGRWYRTIDRIFPPLAQTPKLLIPGIKGEAHIVFEEGKLYPHHNLYYVTSDTWDLRALQAVLLSGIARLFVSIYSTRMRGGYLRFQAQYLRRIRIPHWHNLSGTLRQELIAAATNRDLHACNRAVIQIYNLNPAEATLLTGNGE